MRKTALIAMMTTGLTVPLAAYAQAPSSRPTAPPAAASATSEASSFTLSPEQLLAIAGGAVVGGVLLDFVLPVRVAYLIGGVGGAYLGYTWYTRGLK